MATDLQRFFECAQTFELANVADSWPLATCGADFRLSALHPDLDRSSRGP